MLEERQKRGSGGKRPSQEKGEWSNRSLKSNMNRAETLERGGEARTRGGEDPAGEDPAVLRRAAARPCAREKRGDARALRR